MEIHQMQALIDGADTAEKMDAVGRAYQEGALLRDEVAAEAWLLRAVEQGDPVGSVKAMGSLARLLGKPEPLTDEDYLDIRRRLPTAEGQERQTLLALLELASHRQKNIHNDEKTLHI